MFTLSEIIVGLWFVPVALNILTPLAMFIVWLAIRLVKKTAGVKEPVSQTAQENKKETFTGGLPSQSVA